MTDADIERIVKHVFRKYREARGTHVYVTEPHVRAVVQAAIDLGIVCLNEKTNTLPYSVESVIKSLPNTMATLKRSEDNEKS